MTAALHDLTGFVLNASIKLHRDFGPFLLESVYEQVLAASLTRQGHAVQRQQTIDIVHDGLHIPGAFRADLVVDDLLLIEIKSIARLAPIHTRQVLTYLRLMKLDVGLLINFGGETLKEGFKRLTVASVPSVPSVRS